MSGCCRRTLLRRGVGGIGGTLALAGCLGSVGGYRFGGTPPLTQVWSESYDNSHYDFSPSVARTADGGYAFTGWSTTYDTGSTDRRTQCWAVKTAPDGTVAWSQTFGSRNLHLGKDIVATSDGGFALTAEAGEHPTGGDVVLVKLDSTGSVSWTKTYGESDSDNVNAVVETTDRGFLVGGSKVPADGGSAVGWLVKTTGSGETEWTRTFRREGDDRIVGIVRTDDGGYAVAGETTTDSESGSSWLVKTDENGTTEWQSEYAEEGGALRIHSVICAPDGRFLLTGSASFVGSKGGHGWARSVTSDGTEAWTRKYSNLFQTFATVRRDGNYVIAGTDAGIELREVTPTGEKRWQTTYRGEIESLSDVARAGSDDIVLLGTRRTGTVAGRASTDVVLTRLGKNDEN